MWTLNNASLSILSDCILPYGVERLVAYCPVSIPPQVIDLAVSSTPSNLNGSTVVQLKGDREKKNENLLNAIKIISGKPLDIENLSRILGPNLTLDSQAVLSVINQEVRDSPLLRDRPALRTVNLPKILSFNFSNVGTSIDAKTKSFLENVSHLSLFGTFDEMLHQFEYKSRSLANIRSDLNAMYQILLCIDPSSNVIRKIFEEYVSEFQDFSKLSSLLANVHPSFIDDEISHNLCKVGLILNNANNLKLETSVVIELCVDALDFNFQSVMRCMLLQQNLEVKHFPQALTVVNAPSKKPVPLKPTVNPRPRPVPAGPGLPRSRDPTNVPPRPSTKCSTCQKSVCGFYLFKKVDATRIMSCNKNPCPFCHCEVIIPLTESKRLEYISMVTNSKLSNNMKPQLLNAIRNCPG